VVNTVSSKSVCWIDCPMLLTQLLFDARDKDSNRQFVLTFPSHK
jgi:hypothetical protein